MKKNIISILIVVLTMMALIGCQTINDNVNNNLIDLEESQEEVVEIEAISQPEYGDFGGYFWQVTNGEATVYLFGSIQMADEAMYPFNEAVENAFDSADILGVEADITDTAAAQKLIPLMMYDQDDSLYNHLSEEGIETFEAACDELGLNKNYHSRFKIWVAGSNLMSLQLMRSPYSASEGVDMYFLEKAHEIEKEIIALEGIEFQVNLINDFTDEEQEQAFFTIGSLDETIEEFTKMYEIYMTGNDEQMTSYLFDTDNELTSDDNIEDAMLRDRNIEMAQKIDAYLQTDKTYFIVVGLAHYLGDESVIRYLNDMGYTVERK